MRHGLLFRARRALLALGLVAVGCGGRAVDPLATSPSPDAGAVAEDAPTISHPPTPGTFSCLEYDVARDQILYDPRKSPFQADLVDFAADLTHVYLAANAIADFQAGRVYDVHMIGLAPTELFVDVSPHVVSAIAEADDAVLLLHDSTNGPVVTRAEKGRDARRVLEGSEGTLHVAASRDSRFYAYATKSAVYGPSGVLYRHAPETNVLGLATAGSQAFLLAARDASHSRVLRAGTDGVSEVMAELGAAREGTFASNGSLLFVVEEGSPARLLAFDTKGAKVAETALAPELGTVREIAFDKAGVYVVGTRTGASSREVVIHHLDLASSGTFSAPVTVKSFTTSTSSAARRLFAADSCNIYFLVDGKLHRQSATTLPGR
jgi:hypothetical protein